MSDLDELFNKSLTSLDRSFDPDFFEDDDKLNLTQVLEEYEKDLNDESPPDPRPFKCTECTSGNFDNNLNKCKI